MPLFLSSRDTQSEERMDDPRCDSEKLTNTYRQFGTINLLLSRWNFLYRTEMKPHFLEEKRSYSLLDIGFGGGDISLNIAKWTDRDNIDLKITAIETDARAVEFAQSLNAPGNVHFEECSSTELLQRGLKFDFVISNHLLHHLEMQQLQQFLEEAQKLCKGRVLFNDLERSDCAFLFFNLLARPLFRNSFIVQDGLTSLKRSYTFRELKDAVPEGWHLQKLFPFRLLLSFEQS